MYVFAGLYLYHTTQPNICVYQNVPTYVLLYNNTSAYVHTYLSWCSQHSRDPEQRVNLAASWEERSEGVRLVHDAPHGPQVNGAAVVGGLEHDLRGTVPGGETSGRRRRRYVGMRK